MDTKNSHSENLFSYGTLQLPAVQLDTFGRLLQGAADKLLGYKLSMVEITDPDVIKSSGKNYHPIIKHTGDTKDVVDGMVFKISKEELLAADEYEVDDYKRVCAMCDSGNNAWVYIAKGNS